jgi:hypothetical protein
VKNLAHFSLHPDGDVARHQRGGNPALTHNTIPRFRYGASLKGLRPNVFSCGFISIEMAKIVVGSPRLTQPLLLYTGLGLVMLDNIVRVLVYSTTSLIIR